jgi:Cu(I)/Ag(I) efflux system periplasmic protein CusF
MKSAKVVLFSVLFAALTGIASAAETYAAKGTVNSVDVAAGKTNITHEPVPALKWPGMTMGFVVKDEKGLKQLKTGDRVEFWMAKEGNSYVITKIERSKK